jgi:hypothetical protein
MFLLQNVLHLTKGCSRGQLSVTIGVKCSMTITGSRGELLVMKGRLTDFLDIQ